MCTCVSVYMFLLYSLKTDDVLGLSLGSKRSICLSLNLYGFMTRGSVLKGSVTELDSPIKHQVFDFLVSPLPSPCTDSLRL